MSVSAVIFDIGNVLVEWQPENYYDRIYGVERRKRLFAEVDLHAVNLAIDAGADWKSSIYDCAERHPDWRTEIRDWHDNWIKLAAPLIPHSLRLLRALKAKGVPVFSLTNFGDQTFAYAQGEYVFLSQFDRAYVSGRMKLIKPDPEIYRQVEVDCGLAPETLFFTDDRAENIEAAKARGWQTHLFEGPAGLSERLVALGLLSATEAA
jgi:2-haloacid dehalogenase